MISRETAGEILRVLAYPKFGLSESRIDAFVARYLPYAERIEVTHQTMECVLCRDSDDQKFVWLAISGKADILVSGDLDLLDLRQQARFSSKRQRNIAYAMKESGRNNVEHWK